jgi:hypothetical protein
MGPISVLKERSEGRCELRHENVGGYLVGASLKRIVSFLLPRESDIKGDTRIKGGI